jgi:hypothetical protein
MLRGEIEAIRHRLPKTGALSPRSPPHISRQGIVAELIRWAEGPTGPGLAAIEEAFKTLQNP